jgi:hypothetical protein
LWQPGDLCRVKTGFAKRGQTRDAIDPLQQPSLRQSHRGPRFSQLTLAGGGQRQNAVEHVGTFCGTALMV